MNFQQLRIIKETVRHNFNLTEAAATLFTSPSGVSKHIKDLEQELGIVLFERRGKRLLGLTEPGRELVTIVERILADAGNINRLAQQFAARDEGHLTVATTHTQARYNLPPIVTRFKAAFPNVRLVLRQSSPPGIAALVRDGDADIGIATEAVDREPELATLAYYKWKHTLIVPAGHALETTTSPSLADIAAWPIVTYQEGFSGRGKIDQAFAEANIDIVLSAFDADVLKAYVEVGLGVGIVSSMAFDPVRDIGLRRIDVDGLFYENVAKIAVRRGILLRDFALKFIELCNPALTPNVVRATALADAEPRS